MRIEAKPLQPADTDNNDDDTPTYLEADTQRTVGIPRAAAAAAAAAAPLFCSSFAAGKQKKGAGKTERVKNESEKREREEAQETEMLRKNTKRRKQLVDGIAAMVVIRDAAEFCYARFFATRLLPLVPASLAPSLPASLGDGGALYNYTYNTRYCTIHDILYSSLYKSSQSLLVFGFGIFL